MLARGFVAVKNFVEKPAKMEGGSPISRSSRTGLLVVNMNTDESKSRTPVYESSFGPNTDKLHHLLTFSQRAVKSYFPDLEMPGNRFGRCRISTLQIVSEL
jgi:hypothetical protein